MAEIDKKSWRASTTLQMMAMPTVYVWAYLTLSVLHVAMGRKTWLVSWSGSDRPGCGADLETACATVNFAIDHSLDGDTILIDGRQELFFEEHLYNHCFWSNGTRGEGSITVTTSLTFKGYGGVAFMGCETFSQEYTIFSFVGARRPGEELPVVTIDNLWLQNGAVRFTDVRLLVKESLFVNATLRTPDHGCQEVRVDVEDSQFSRQALCESDTDCNRIVDSAIHCQNVTANLFKVEFQDTNVVIHGSEWAHVNISRSTFSKILIVETGMGGVNVTLPYQHGRLYVSNCLFWNLVHIDPIYSAINIEAAALRISATRPHVYLGESVYDAEVLVEDCEFRGNERGISITKRFKYVTIKRCYFNTNTGMHAASGIRFAVNHTDVLVADSVFESNTAGHNWHPTIPGRFEQGEDQVQIHNKLINGVISMVGKGGAVRIHLGNVTFRNCTFLNNTARLLGGSLFVDRMARAQLEDSTFKNSDKHSLQGEILYSTGLIVINRVNFIVTSSEDHLSIIRHSGEHWSLSVHDMWFQCPVGQRLLMVNTTSHKIIPNVGLKRSHKLDQMHYYCQTCGKNQYSLDEGNLNYTLTGNTTEYHTLLINGEQPFKQHSVKFNYGNITCHDCPYGGDCEHGLIAVANFWGYHYDNAISFQHCPPDYCCTSRTCQTFDGCAKHRHGRLCGQCMPGYSEALFSSRCVPDETCNNLSWVLPLTLAMGLLYAAFLVFQKDVRDFLSSWKLDLKRVPGCVHRKPFMVTYMQQRAEVNMKALVGDRQETEPLRNNSPAHNSEATTVTADRTSFGSVGRLTGEEGGEEGTVKSKEASFLIILFYYFQDSLLLHIDTVYTKTASKLEKQLKAFLLGLFRFRLDFYQFLDDICLLSGMQPVTKIVLKMLFVPFILLLFAFLYYVLKTYVRLKIRQGNRTPKIQKTLTCKLASGFVLALLFTYQKMATATFALLNCVPVGDKKVLFIDGTQTCFQTWQYAIMGYAFTSVVPFSLILMIGPPLLKRRQISLQKFFLGCVCPLPSLTYWLIRDTKTKTSTKPLPEPTSVVLNLLQGPFKEPKSKKLIGQLCWAGVLIARRLILFLCFTFINDVLLRLLCMLGVCFIILMHHMYVRPYNSFYGNLAGAISAAALLIVGAINLLRASFEAAEYIPAGPYKPLMQACEEVENTLVLWLPLAGMCILIIFLIVRIFLKLLAVTIGVEKPGSISGSSPQATRVISATSSV